MDIHSGIHARVAAELPDAAALAVGLTASRFPPDLTRERTLDPTGWRKVRSHLAAAAYNAVVTFIPSHVVRQTFLRMAGMRIGRQVGMLRGAKVTRPDHIEVGDHCIIGFDCFLGGEGRLFIGNNVNIASFSVLLGGRHDINDPAFTSVLQPTVIEDYAWVATRVTIASGVRIGRGAVVGAGAVVTRDVAPYAVVAGVPARVIGERRPDACVYELNYQPWFF